MHLAVRASKLLLQLHQLKGGDHSVPFRRHLNVVVLRKNALSGASNLGSTFVGPKLSPEKYAATELYSEKLVLQLLHAILILVIEQKWRIL